MAKVNGILNISGTLHGINFYARKGQLIARKAGGGFTSESIKNNPKMEGVRNNGKELGAASRIAKAFRIALKPYLPVSALSSLPSKVVKQFLAVKNQDLISEHGLRHFLFGLQSEAGRALMTGYSLPIDVVGQAKLNGHFALNQHERKVLFKPHFYDLIKIPKKVDVVSLQFGVLGYESVTSSYVFYPFRPVFLPTQEDLPQFISFPDDVLVDSNSMLVVIIRQYYKHRDELVLIDTKSAYYFEVLGVFE